MNAREHERRSETRLARCQHAKGWRLAGERVQTMPLGALLLGHYTDDGKLVYAGRVGTGMSDKVLADLRRRLEPLSRAKSPLKIPPPRKTRFGSPLGLSGSLGRAEARRRDNLSDLDGGTTSSATRSMSGCARTSGSIKCGRLRAANNASESRVPRNAGSCTESALVRNEARAARVSLRGLRTEEPRQCHKQI
jgi:hypothetical protein